MTCLIHDLEESRSGDQNWINKRFIKVFDEEIREGQIKPLPGADELLELSRQYQKRETLAARLAKEAYHQPPSEWWNNLWTPKRRK